MARPALSVITATRNRRELLMRKLESLARQTLSLEAFEVIVCDDASTDGTAEELAAARVPFRLVTLTQERAVGAARARNRAAEAAQGNVLYMSDDDCLLDPETLALHMAAQRRRPGVAIGAICFEDGEGSSLWRPHHVRYWNLNGANASMPRQAFEAVGGFDEGVETYGGEDVLLGYWLWKRGLDFLALPEAAVRHQGPDPRAGRDVAKARSAGANAVQIAARHPELAFRLGVHPALLALKRLIFNEVTAPLFRRPRHRYERAYLEGALEERRYGG